MFLIRYGNGAVMILHGPRPARGQDATRQDGYTIIELMVAMTIGLLILAGLTTIFARNSRARAEIDRANQQTENGRYALQLLTDDLRNAGYFAELNPVSLPTPASKPDPCASDVATLNAAMPVAVQGYDNGASAPTCLSDLRGGTDILVVRRASTCAVGDTDCDPLINGTPYLQVSGCATELAAGTVMILDTNTTTHLHMNGCSTNAPLHQYRTHIYFVANNDKPGDGIPTLKRMELGAAGFAPVPLVEGIENLQIEYGLDTSVPSTGSPAVYTANPDSYNSCTPATCVSYWRNTVAAKIHLLARSTTSTRGYVDTKTYILGLNANGQTYTVPAPGDAFKRHAYESVVRLNNVAGRNTP